MTHEERIKWFREAGYGMMAHWGLYSLLAGEWKGQRADHNYAEWIMANRAIPIKEYEKLAQAFNPVFFDADEWIRTAKDSGMKYFVLTSKHHDGFAMYHSEVDKYNVVDATPFGRDAAMELAEACYKYGLGFGLYYSQDLDWHEKDGGGYLHGHIPCAGKAWCNAWDFPDNAEKNYERCFRNKIYPQVEEIVRNYGELCLIWFDVPKTITEDQSRELYDLVRHYQPGCLINSRLGNGIYDYVSFGDNEIPEEMPPRDEELTVDLSDTDGFKPSPYGLYETAATMNDSWGYCAFDQNWKTAGEIREIHRKLNSLGINYLLNVGPDALGRIPAKSIEILRESI